MVDPRYFLAASAGERCAAGEFVLCGCVLQPFSFRHELQLEAAGNPLWADTEDKVTVADYFEAAVICAHRKFVGEIPEPTAEDIADFDLAEAERVWRRYIAACYECRPEIAESGGGGGEAPKAPIGEYVATFILRHDRSHSREELLTMAKAYALWIFESIVEQICPGPSRLVSPEDRAQMAAMSMPDYLAAKAEREAIGREICETVKNATERQAMLAQLMSGTLPTDWRKRAKTGKRARKARRV